MLRFTVDKKELRRQIVSYNGLKFVGMNAKISDATFCVDDQNTIISVLLFHTCTVRPMLLMIGKNQFFVQIWQRYRIIGDRLQL